MKIIVINHYWIEEYYQCEHTFPVEYSSIEDLRKFIETSYENYKNEKIQYEKDLKDWHAKVNNIKGELGYNNLVEELKICEKQYNKNAGTTKRTDRTEVWHFNQKVLEEKISTFKKKIDELQKSLPEPPKLKDYIEIGSWRINFGYYTNPFSLDNYEFYSVEEWIGKFLK